MEEAVVEEIERLLTSEDDEQLKVYLDDLNISDVEHLIDELPQHAVKFIETLSAKRAVNVFRILDFPTQEKIIKKLPGDKLGELINLLPPDDRTSLFSELKGDAVAKLIRQSRSAVLTRIRRGQCWKIDDSRLRCGKNGLDR
jgi:magnesium transporter